VQGEVNRDDLTLATPTGTVRIEFKVAWNNKNLFGGYNGTGGIAEDIAKLKNCTFNQKLVVAFLCFFDRRVFEELGRFYYSTSRTAGLPLQPAGSEDFRAFAETLAGKVGLAVSSQPEPVRMIHEDDGRWFGVWVHRVP